MSWKSVPEERISGYALKMADSFSMRETQAASSIFLRASLATLVTGGACEKSASFSVGAAALFKAARLRAIDSSAAL